MKLPRTLTHGQGILVAIVTLLALGGWMLYFEIDTPVGSGVLAADKLDDLQSTAIKVTLDLFQLLMTWALAIIGATGFFLKLNLEKGIQLRQIDLLLSLLIVIASVLSLYFGHLGFDRSAELLSLRQYPVREHGLRLLGRLQYLSFFSAVLLFGLHIFQFFWARLLQASSSKPAGESDAAI